MKIIPTLSPFVLLTCLTPALVPAPAFAQDQPDAAKMEEVMKKYGNPGKEHRTLRAMAGTWKAESNHWMMADTPPMKATGESKVRMIMKGRYLSETFTTETEQFGAFQGLGTLAYDRLAGEYVHTWIDTMGTGIMISRGKPSGDPDRIELQTTFKDPFSMLDIKYRIVYKGLKGPKREMEMFATYPDQKEFRTMQIIYTKVAEPAKRKAAGTPGTTPE